MKDMTMRKASTLVGLIGLLAAVATAGTARAQEGTGTPVAAAEASPAPASQRRLALNLAFVPMSLGKIEASYGGMIKKPDAAFAPGVSISVSYRVVEGLTLGLAPQVFFNVGPKEDPLEQGSSINMFTEIDAMARVAYVQPLVETIAVYVEALPGYSILKPQNGDPAKGFVIAASAGLVMDLTDRIFVNLAGGYQVGFQSRTDDQGVNTVNKNRFVRTVFGVGWRL